MSLVSQINLELPHINVLPIRLIHLGFKQDRFTQIVWSATYELRILFRSSRPQRYVLKR